MCGYSALQTPHYPRARQASFTSTSVVSQSMQASVEVGVARDPQGHDLPKLVRHAGVVLVTVRVGGFDHHRIGQPVGGPAHQVRDAVGVFGSSNSVAVDTDEGLKYEEARPAPESSTSISDRPHEAPGAGQSTSIRRFRTICFQKISRTHFGWISKQNVRKIREQQKIARARGPGFGVRGCLPQSSSAMRVGWGMRFW